MISASNSPALSGKAMAASSAPGSPNPQRSASQLAGTAPDGFGDALGASMAKEFSGEYGAQTDAKSGGELKGEVPFLAQIPDLSALDAQSADLQALIAQTDSAAATPGLAGKAGLRGDALGQLRLEPQMLGDQGKKTPEAADRNEKVSVSGAPLEAGLKAPLAARTPDIASKDTAQGTVAAQSGKTIPASLQGSDIANEEGTGDRVLPSNRQPAAPLRGQSDAAIQSGKNMPTGNDMPGGPNADLARNEDGAKNEASGKNSAAQLAATFEKGADKGADRVAGPMERRLEGSANALPAKPRADAQRAAQTATLLGAKGEPASAATPIASKTASIPAAKPTGMDASIDGTIQPDTVRLDTEKTGDKAADPRTIPVRGAQPVRAAQISSTTSQKLAARSNVEGLAVQGERQDGLRSEITPRTRADSIAKNPAADQASISASGAQSPLHSSANSSVQLGAAAALQNMAAGITPNTAPPPVSALVQPSATGLDKFAPAQMEQAIDQLTQAKEAARISRPELTVRHAEFGAINMRLEAAGGDLRATLSNRDPGFIPAIQAALTDRVIAPTSESSSSTNNPSGSRHSEQRHSENGSGGSHMGGQNSGQWGSENGADGRYGSFPRENDKVSKPSLEHLGDDTQNSQPAPITSANGSDVMTGRGSGLFA